MRLRVALPLTIATLGLLSAGVSADNGVLDPSFGDGGIATQNFDTVYPSIYDRVAAQSDGKVVALGTADSGEGRWTTVIDRVLADGSADTSFGDGGRVAIDLISDQYEYPAGLEIDSSGNIFALVGYPGDAVILGLNSAGEPLSGFGTDGIARFELGDTDEFKSMALSPDGSIVAVGTAAYNSGTSIAVWKITSAGVIDTSFGTSGLRRIDLNDNSFAADVAVLADSSILVVANTLSGDGYEWSTVLVKYTAAGIPDNSFNAIGFAEPDLGGSTIEDEAVAVHALANGTFLVAVALENAQGHSDMAVARFTAAGALDTTFNTTGIATHGPGDGTSNYVPTSLDVLADGTIIVAGYRGSLLTLETIASMAAFTSSGAAISAFGAADGDAGSPASIEREFTNYLDVAVSGTGASERITVAGSAKDVATYIEAFLARFDTDGLIDTGFDSNGVVDRPLSDGSGAPEYLNSAIELPDGRILAIGFELGGSGFAYATRLTMHLADGSLDTSWGTDGSVVDPEGVGLPTSALIDDQGRILSVGFQFNGPVMIRRYLSDGAVDSTFGTGGLAERPAEFTQIGAEAYPAVILDDEGRILVGSGLFESPTADMYVYRLTADGALDSSFGTGGATRVDATSFDGAIDLTLDDSGRIIAVGYGVNDDSDTVYLIARLTPDGELDTTFGESGTVMGALSGAEYSFASRVAIDGDGRMVIGFVKQVDSDTTFVVQRFLAEGSPDQTFTEISIASEFDEGVYPRVMIRPDGRIIVVTYQEGENGFYSFDSELRAFGPDGEPDTNFGTDGVIYLDGFLVQSIRSVSRGDILLGAFEAVNEIDSNRAIIRVLGELSIVPAALEAPVLSADGSSITATWSEPIDDGAPRPTSYTLTLTPGGASCTVTELTCTIDDLDPGTEYAATVRAANRIGSGPESSSAEVSTATPPTTTTTVASTTTTVASTTTTVALSTTTSAVPTTTTTEPSTLPATGGTDRTSLVALAMALGALAVLASRRQAAR